MADTAKHLRHIDRMSEQIELLNDVGIALSNERDPVRLMERILLGAKSLTNADGGTIYSLAEGADALHFEIMRTDSLGIALGGPNKPRIDFPPVKLHRENGEPNKRAVVAYAVLENRTVNIADAYDAPGFDFSGTRAFDEKTGYRSRSMLTVPMRNHEDEITGVLQLLNARNDRGEIIAFSETMQRLIESVASQAAIASTRTKLMKDMEALFESFVRLIADAIDAKSPYTGGHCRRVPIITMMLADAACDTIAGELCDFELDDLQRYELNIAALLHDCGKITTPEWVMDKATKLQTVYDRIREVAARYAVLKAEARVAAERRIAAGENRETVESELKRTCNEMDDELDFLRRANVGGEFMSDDHKARVVKIAERRWRDVDGYEQPLLSEEEVENLCIARGTLNDDERQVIQNHIVATIDMLESLPYPKHLRRVPEYAGAHHERVDGAGYPRGLVREQMSWPARMMAIADVFEALTASDRPYKKAMPLSRALTILGHMKEEGHIDPDLFDVFIRQEVWKRYAEEHLSAEQRDEVDMSKIPGFTV